MVTIELFCYFIVFFRFLLFLFVLCFYICLCFLPFRLSEKVESKEMRMIENIRFLQVGLIIIFIFFNYNYLFFLYL